MIPVSIGICAYNEEKNIKNLLQSISYQKLKDVTITELIVVSSGSTDSTESIVGEYSKGNTHVPVSLIIQEERKGKASAINEFLKKTKEDVVILTSADVIFDARTVENLIKPLINNEKIGMTSVNPIPTNNQNSFMGYVSHIHWRLHNKFRRHGETIAFRKNLVPKVAENTAVDEAYIESIIFKKGYKLFHVKNAIVYNKGAESISDFIKQIRRHYAGHLDLKRRMNNYTVTSAKFSLSINILIKEAAQNMLQFHYFVGYILLELLGRVLGFYDFYIKKKNPYIWDIAESTKRLK